MFEKVNPAHPDKIADRIAGAVVDLAYKAEENPKIAVEVLIGHGKCHVIAETTVSLTKKDIDAAVKRIAGENIKSDIAIVPQDSHLTENQSKSIKCGDNGIFKGAVVTEEQKQLTELVRSIYKSVPRDGKYILNNGHIVMCQSCIDTEKWRETVNFKNITINPLGNWTGGTDVDTGATNRKLGSDMGDSVTGGGLHGKDLSKADVSVNIYAFLKAQETGKNVELCCAIGDETIDGKPYSEIVSIARDYITQAGGFEKFAEWGLI